MGRSKTLIRICTMTALVALLAGCGAANYRTEIDTLEKEIEVLRQAGAARCAPRELAAAETHLEFAGDDVATKAYLSADDHIVVVRENVAAAREFMSTCAKLAREGGAIPQP
ncbi:hypothetical protein K8I61_01715 [bacterium]|nr:hypothetical protein [bacterium]